MKGMKVSHTRGRGQELGNGTAESPERPVKAMFGLRQLAMFWVSASGGNHAIIS